MVQAVNGGGVHGPAPIWRVAGFGHGLGAGHGFTGRVGWPGGLDLANRDDPALAPLAGNVKVTRQDWLNAALDVLRERTTRR